MKASQVHGWIVLVLVFSIVHILKQSSGNCKADLEQYSQYNSDHSFESMDAFLWVLKCQHYPITIVKLFQKKIQTSDFRNPVHFEYLPPVPGLIRCIANLPDFSTLFREYLKKKLMIKHSWK